MEDIRILVVDDDEGVLDSYKNIFGLSRESASDTRIQDLQAQLYGTDSSPANAFPYDITYHQQANDAIQAVRVALNNNQPYAMTFLDVRMPPGPDGVWAAEKIRGLDPLINIVMVTAYSDIDPAEISSRVQPLDKLLYIQKPFHIQEIQQFGAALGAKWLAERRILNINKELEEKINSQTADLEATTIALRQLVKENERDKKDMQDKILFGVNEMIKPYIAKLKKCNLSGEALMCSNVIESNLDEIVAPFMHGLAYKYFRLTPKEIHIANLIKQGKSTKEIAVILNLTSRGIEFHRDKIRGKIGIKHNKAHLREVLHDLEIEFMSS